MGLIGGLTTALSAVNTLLTTLNDPLLKETFFTFVSSDRLEKLKGSVTTVKSLLLDAANKDELSETVRDYINKLKDVVYDADDLFDELVTRAERKDFDDDNIFEKVCQLFLSIETSVKVRELRLKLDDIADDHAKFGLGISTTPHRRVRPIETCSHVSASDVVGRNDDANKVIGMLLDSGICAYFLAIVGIGGMGKTTLAKLVFRDEKITAEFPIRLWVCVSDQDGATLDVKQILLKILESLECRFDSSSSVDILHREYQRNLQGKKFLIVLDDIWSEKIVELDNLKKRLKIDGSKGRIIATTRSKETARIIGNGTHELKGLSDEHSRVLFEMKAFGDNGEKPAELVEIGEKIVKKSSNVPLSIMVIGTLLYGQPVDKWHTFLMSGFNRFSKGMDEIMSTLKISYDNLDPSLRSCFAYCAIFPKDFVIRKELIINLWDAQGYIVPFDEGQSIENAGEEHFSVLLQRCFFQDVNKNEDGGVVSFKIHDLMHDLAQRVSGKEICMINSSIPDLKCSVRHILFDGLNIDDIKLKSKIRSYLIFHDYQQVRLGDKLPTYEMSKDWSCLRALALQWENVRLPDTIGNWLHLRYLNLAYSNLKKLPDSIVKLYNLQTLDLTFCKFLEEWPKDFGKLVNLTHLYTFYCLELSCMPVGLSSLSRISILTEFIVEDETASGMQRVAQLTDLKALVVNLKGRLSIRFGKEFICAEGYDWGESFFEHAEHLNEVAIRFPLGTELIHSQIVMEKLKPHRNLRKFIFINNKVKKIATWGRAQDNWATFFPNLVVIYLRHCFQVQELPMLSKLPHLKSLSLLHFMYLEYMEEEVTSSTGSGSFDNTFFPSLEYLRIYHLTNLRSWWRPGNCNESHCQPAFPKLSNLYLEYCRHLQSFPRCLSSPKVELKNINDISVTTANGVHTSTY
ncbi:disease resistance protein RGA2-like [Silene latifolia]|uniref:disease resistance protein RGA2-like n=1 Tax=Silene latifolia TaxID=37657 RepID=UPI003D782E1E